MNDTINKLLQAAREVCQRKDFEPTYASAFMMMIGRHVSKPGSVFVDESGLVEFVAVPDTMHSDDVYTGTCVRQYRDQRGRLYTVMITPHEIEE